MATTAAIDEEATAFAMELLMPTQFLVVDIKKAGGIDIGDDAQLNALAKRYKVDPQLMAIRIGQLLGKV